MPDYHDMNNDKRRAAPEPPPGPQPRIELIRLSDRQLRARLTLTIAVGAVMGILGFSSYVLYTGTLERPLYHIDVRASYLRLTFDKGFVLDLDLPVREVNVDNAQEYLLRGKKEVLASDDSVTMRGAASRLSLIKAQPKGQLTLEPVAKGGLVLNAKGESISVELQVLEPQVEVTGDARRAERPQPMSEGGRFPDIVTFFSEGNQKIPVTLEVSEAGGLAIHELRPVGIEFSKSKYSLGDESFVSSVVEGKMLVGEAGRVFNLHSEDVLTLGTLEVQRMDILKAATESALTIHIDAFADSCRVGPEGSVQEFCTPWFERVCRDDHVQKIVMVALSLAVALWGGVGLWLSFKR